MSLNGTAQTFVPYTLNGINTLATPNDISSCVKYNGNTSDTNLDGYDLGTTGTLSAQFHAIPDTLSNSESWVTYAISTNGNLSTVGGLITQDLTNGRLMYFTGGVVGAPSFQFTTMGTSGKVVVTDGNSVMSTTISAGQLDYITALTSQAGGVGQQNTWSDVQIHSADVSTTGSARFIQPYNAGVLEVSTLVNRATLDSAISAIPNLLTLSNTWSGTYNQFNGTVSTMGSNRFIQPYNAVSADISTVVNRATLDSAIAGLGAGILTLNNTWSGTNTFNSTLTTAVGQTTSINGALSTSLVDLGFTSASFTTAGITGAYTSPLGTITNPSGSTYQITQTAAGRSIMAISGFTPSVGITYIFEFNINCTIGTATISVEQDNILVSPALYPLTTGFNRVVGSFTYNGTPNTVVFKIYTGVASWNAQWDSFILSTYSIGMNANMNALTVNNRFTQRYNALAGDVSTLINRATLDAVVSTSATPNLLPLSNVWTGTNTFNNTVQVSGIGVNLGVSLGSIIKTTATVGSFSQLTGGGATSSPALEFHFGGSRRGYVGDCTASDLVIASDNSAKLNFATAGTSRMTIDTSGNISTSAGKFIATSTIANINGGSGYAVGAGYMSAGSFTLGDHTKNYGGGVSGWNSNTAGLLFECLSNTEIAVHDGGDRVASFMYYSGNTFTIGRDMGWGGGNISMPGIVSITGALTFGYSRYLYSPEVAGATYGSMCVKGAGRNGWQGYSIYNTANQQVSFMMVDGAQSHGIYNATAGIWSLYVDVPNGLTYLQSAVGNTPIAFNPGSWNTGGGGYTLITRVLGNNTSALAFGSSPGRGVIISLTAGVVWNELILSGGTIYTSCYGTINNYTNGGGWVYSSDKRVKKDIKPLKTTRSLERIISLKPMTYKKIYHPEKSDTPIPQEVMDADHIGFLAQDVMETNPHCVSEWVDDNCVCDDDDGKRLGIAYGDINIHMVGAIQELKKQNDAQQKEIDELREMVKALMDRVRQ